MVWDIHGDDEFQKVRMSYVRGAAGYLLVVDSTRRSTLDTAISLHDSVERTVGAVPFLLVINKVDLADQWDLDDRALVKLGWRAVKTSAKTGAGVEEAFAKLARELIA